MAEADQQQQAVDPDEQVDGHRINAAPNDNNAVRQIQIKIPPFWKADPALWFFQIEAQFATAGIRADLSKYNQIVGKLDTDTLTAVSDIVKNPPANDKYLTLRNRLTNQFTESDRKKLKTLFNDLSLTDDKPSDLIRKMRDKSCNMIGDDLLHELWSNRLPQQIQSILSCSNAPLNEKIIMADKIFETLDLNSIQVLSKKDPQFDSDLAKQFSKLEDKIDSLQYEINKSRSRNSSSRRHRSSSGSSKRTTQKPDTHCWYHKLYKDKAIKCTEPCSYHDNKDSKN